jgi:hypothetical protein
VLLQSLEQVLGGMAAGLVALSVDERGQDLASLRQKSRVNAHLHQCLLTNQSMSLALDDSLSYRALALFLYEDLHRVGRAVDHEYIAARFEQRSVLIRLPLLAQKLE